MCRIRTHSLQISLQAGNLWVETGYGVNASRTTLFRLHIATP
jgi:hypothetical protein